MSGSLYFCRTPLQVLIVNHLMQREGGQPTVVYHPISRSPKHRYYFEKLQSLQKHFVEYTPPPCPDTVSDLLAWFRIPRQVRSRRYGSIYVGSIGSIPFSMLAQRNRQAELYTFDDGAFNVAPAIFRDWIEHEPRARRRVKLLFGGLDNVRLVQRSAAHFTIFPARLAAISGPRVEELSVFPAGEVTASKGERVRVILGTVYPDPGVQGRHDQIVDNPRFDLFLPHPIDPRKARVSPKLSIIDSDDLPKMIAEDVVATLVAKGFHPTVYGFDSTALLNLSRTVPTVTIQLHPGLETLDARLLSVFGTRLVKWYDRTNGAAVHLPGVKMWTNPSART